MPVSAQLLAPLCVALMLLPVPALAQDMMDQAIDQSSMAMSLYAGSVPIEEDVRRSLRCDHVAPLHRSPKCGPSSKSPPRPTGSTAKPRPASLAYASTPAIRRQAVDQFVARVGARDAGQARTLRAQLARNDYDKAYRGIAAPFGLRADDAGDTMTAYLLLGWMIANGSGDPRAADVRGVRAQIGKALSSGRAMADPGQRALLGEEFKLLFVVVHAGWQSARRDGSLPRYANGVADMIRTQAGIDLRKVRLAGGFVPR